MTIKQLASTALCSLAFLTMANAQSKPIKFGVHVDPFISFMGSNEKPVRPDGANVGLNLGVEMEFYFNEKDNYAFTVGGAFAAGVGGRLKYEYANGAVLLPKSELDRLSFEATVNNQTIRPDVPGNNIYFAPNTTVRYRVNYVSTPLGLKLRTNELGGSFFRAFFHIPIITPMVAISARGNISAPSPADGGGVADPAELTAAGVNAVFSGESSKENIYGDVFPIQIALGVGAGVEFSPQEETGLRIVGGLYFDSGLIDMTSKHGAGAGLSGNKQNPRTGFNMISLRLGVIF